MPRWGSFLACRNFLGGEGSGRLFPGGGGLVFGSFWRFPVSQYELGLFVGRGVGSLLDARFNKCGGHVLMAMFWRGGCDVVSFLAGRLCPGVGVFQISRVVAPELVFAGIVLVAFV